MTVTVRTNLAWSKVASKWGAVAGTGGTATGAWNGGAGYVRAGFWRVTWSAATTSPSGGLTFTQTGLSPSTQYTHQVLLRSSKAQTVAVTAQYQTSGAVNDGAAVTGSSIALTANTWTAVPVTATSGASTAQVVLTAAATGAGTNWANGDTFDGDLVVLVAEATPGPVFDGAFVSAAGVIYAWTASADASTSTATTYQPVLTLTQGSTPSPNVVVTMQDLDPNTDVVNIWRTVDGIRRPVRGARRRSVVGSDFVTDYEAPLGRTISYDMEILTGICAGVTVTTATTTISNPASGWLSDPLVPSSAVAVYADVGPNGEPGLDFDALASWDYAATVSKMAVMGTNEPVLLVGQRQAGSGIDVNMTTLATAQSSALRSLVKQAGTLLFRPLPGWASGLPALCYLAAAAIKEMPQNEKFGGQMVAWKAKGDIGTPPAANIVAPTTTYGTVSGNYSTYGAFVAAHPGQTYLDVIKAP